MKIVLTTVMAFAISFATASNLVEGDGIIGCATQDNSVSKPILQTTVETGEVRGDLIEGSMALYKAIPYAAPPVGKLRWCEPQPAKSWSGVLHADKFGPYPPQPTTYHGKVTMSEDCLNLAVVTPATRKEDKLPVMVWIHGGGFQTETYGNDIFTSLVKKGIVLVSIEYRTGALGFMAHPELSKESKSGHSGNYGILDQIFALKWIQRNISAFGGDPTKVTIFGESAGAISVSILCGSPLAKGLFRGAISQSGGFFSPWSDKRSGHIVNSSQKGAEEQGLAFQKHLKAKSIKDLRKMDALSLAGDNVGFGGFWPCMDGYVITDDYYRNYEKGNFNDVPCIVMTNSDEGAMFTREMSVDSYKKNVESTYGNFAQDILKLYPGNNADETYSSNGDLFRDNGFAWPSFAWTSLHSVYGKSSIYAAYLSQPSTMSVLGDKKRHGVSHADDILYIKGDFQLPGNINKHPVEAALSDIMQNYWVNFAKSGNPNAPGMPYWPSFNKDKETTMQFSNGASLIPVPNRDKIDIMDKFYKKIRETAESERDRLKK